MFLGEYHHNIDIKGRLAVPAKFRQDLGGGAVVTRGIDKCLFIFPKNSWKKLVDKLVELPISQASSRAFVRLMLSGASEAEFDSQGRMLIPNHLRNYAGLDKNVAITGLYDKIEIWNEKEWEKYKNNTESKSEQIAEKMGEMGI